MRQALMNSMEMEKIGSMELVEQWQKTHNHQMLNEIIKRHEFLIKKISRFYDNYHVDKNILFIEGTMGLINSLEKFNPNKNVKLSTYSYFWIRQFIQKYVLKTSVLVNDLTDMKLEPKHSVNNHSAFDDIYEDLEQSYNKALNLAIYFLNDLEKKIFDMRYKEKLTLKEVGKKLYLSGERIRQLEKNIITKLREHIINYSESISGFFKIHNILFYIYTYIMENEHYLLFLKKIVTFIIQYMY